MQTLPQLRTQIKDLLTADSRFGALEVRHEFAGGTGVIPTTTPIFVIGVEQVETALGGLGGYLGQADRTGFHGLDATVTLRFTLLLPERQPLVRWDDVFEGLCECLFSAGLGVEQVWCEPATALWPQQATATVAKARLQTLLTVSESVPSIREVVTTYQHRQGGMP